MAYAVYFAGYSGDCRREGYRHWFDVETFDWDIPAHSHTPVEMSLTKALDALDPVLYRKVMSGKGFRYVRVHGFDGEDDGTRLRFDNVLVTSTFSFGGAFLAMTSVGLSAARWRAA